LGGSLLNQNTVVFSPNEESLTNDFLYYLIQTTGYRDHLDLHAHGTANQASLNVSDMLHIRIPLPTPNEQVEIAEYLERNMSLMDDLSAEAERAIELLQERRTALISAAVTGKIDVRGFDSSSSTEC
jgi:type I restriction enzyme S subunit